jgi:hypothetical protein
MCPVKRVIGDYKPEKEAGSTSQRRKRRPHRN